MNRQIEITHAKRVNERGHTVGVDSYFASYNGERVPACSATSVKRADFQLLFCSTRKSWSWCLVSLQQP